MTVHIPRKTAWQLLWSALGLATVIVVSKKYQQFIKLYGPYVEAEGHWRCRFRRRAEEDDIIPEWESQE